MKNHHGFTLIELIVAIGLAAILASVAMPNMISWTSNAKVSSASRQVLSSIQHARIHAIKVNKMTHIEFSEAGESYEIRKWSPETEAWKIEIHSLPGGVQMKSAFGSGRVLSFDGRGLPASMGNVVLNNNSGKTIRITVSKNGMPRIADS